MTIGRLRLLFAMLALILGALAAIARTPVNPVTARARATARHVYKPANGC